MSSSAMAQINVRIDRELKEKGDAELARLGISPSEAVRSLWERLSAGGREARGACALAKSKPAAGARADIERRLSALKRSERLFSSFADEMGLDLSTFAPHEDDSADEIRRSYYSEKYGV